MEHPLLESWSLNQKTNLQLLDLIPNAQLYARYGARTRTVANTWAHMHHVRLQWLGAGDLDQEEGLERIGRKEAESTDFLKKHLELSSHWMQVFLQRGIEKEKIPDFNGTPTAFLSYLIAHEAHHRGQIIVSLRLNGHLLGSEGIHSLWNWGGGS